MHSEFWTELSARICSCSSCFQEVQIAEVEVITDYKSQLIEYEDYAMEPEGTDDFNSQFQNDNFCFCDGRIVSDTLFSDNCRYCQSGCSK